MGNSRLLVAALLLMLWTGPSDAGVLFSKGQKPNPAERVPELINIVRTSLDEHKRVQAAEELRQYDAAAFPAMVPTLLDALVNDPKPAVRSTAAETLSKLRPVSAMVGRALEQAQSNDTSMRVRLQARYALMQYHWSGYHSAKKNEPPLLPAEESPAAKTPSFLSRLSPSNLFKMTSSSSEKGAAPTQGPRLTPIPSGRSTPNEPPLVKPASKSKEQEGPELFPNP